MHHRRALGDQPGDEAPHAAAAHDLLDPAQEQLRIRQRSLRRPQVGLVQHQVQRLAVRLVERLGERRHEPAQGRAATQLRKVHHAGEQRVLADQAAEGGAHAVIDVHVGVAAAEHHDGVARCSTVGRGAQSPPHAERVQDAHAPALVQRPLDQALGRVGFARTRGADDRHAFVQRRERQHAGDLQATAVIGHLRADRHGALGPGGAASTLRHGLRRSPPRANPSVRPRAPAARGAGLRKDPRSPPSAARRLPGARGGPARARTVRAQSGGSRRSSP